MKCLLLAFSIPVLVAAQSPQLPGPGVQAPPDSPGLALLRQTAKHYADAASYRLEFTELEKSTSEYSQSTNKTVLIAAEAPGHRFHFEGHSSTGSTMKIADGKTVWSYQIDAHRYTVKPQTAAVAADKGAQIIMDQTTMEISEMARNEAEQTRKWLANYAESFQSAQLLPDDNLSIDGAPVACRVVRVQSSDLKRISGNYRFERTIYIEEARGVILEIRERAQNVMQSGGASIPLETERTTRYTVADLDGPISEDIFRFDPPADARLVTDFPSSLETMGGTNRAGQPVPPLKFKTSDGRVLPLESYRGKPVLLDFWATWCAPCVAALPQLAAVYREAKDKGLVLISVDQDEDPDKAADFLAKKGYDWPDFHDGDGEIEKLIGSAGIPHIVLVDGQGQIVLDTLQPTEEKLRGGIAKLGPEFASMAPKAKANPCMVAK